MKKIFFSAFMMMFSSESILCQETSKLGNSKAKYVAFLVGANDYKELEPLKYPVQDIRNLKETLKEYSFSEDDILSVENPTENIFFEKINELTKKVKSIDCLLVYVSIHGLLHDNRKYFWMPIDASSSEMRTWIYVENFLDALDKINCKHILLIVDSCFGGNVYKVMNNKSGLDDAITEKMIEKYISRRSAIAITSGTNAEKVPDNSHFFRALNYTLQSNDYMFLPAESFFYKIKREVNLEQNKTSFKGLVIDPQMAKIAYLKDDDGQFVFYKKNGKAPQKNTDNVLINNNFTQLPPTNTVIPTTVLPFERKFKLGAVTHEEVFQLNKGDKLKVSASGTINVGAILGDVQPSGRKVGLLGLSIEKYNIAKGISHGSLIYRLGPDKPWQPCGDKCEIIAPKTSELAIEFMVNDNNVGDNSGEFEVIIQKK